MSFKLGLDYAPYTSIKDAGQNTVVKGRILSPVVLPFVVLFPQTINTDITVPAGYNALMSGEYDLADGSTITVEAGASLVIA